MEKWQIGIFILILLLFSGLAIVMSEQASANIGLKTEASATCPAAQFATGENTSGAFQCSAGGAQTAVSTEAVAGCGGAGQAFTTESNNGGVGCGTFLTTQTNVSTESAAGCAANQFATTESSNGGLGCGGVSTELASNCAANQFAINESANGGLGCKTALTTQTAVSTELSSGCNDGTFYVNSENAAGVVACDAFTLVLKTNSSTCTDTTATTVLMAGTQLSFTPITTGDFMVTINFQITIPSSVAEVNSKYQVAFGTGKEPICNAAQTGTTIGQQYEIGSVATLGNFEQKSVTIVLLNKIVNTRYWIDLQITDSNTASWTYSLPQIAVIEI